MGDSYAVVGGEGYAPSKEWATFVSNSYATMTRDLKYGLSRGHLSRTLAGTVTVRRPLADQVRHRGVES